WISGSVRDSAGYVGWRLQQPRQSPDWRRLRNQSVAARHDLYGSDADDCDDDGGPLGGFLHRKHGYRHQADRSGGYDSLGWALWLDAGFSTERHEYQRDLRRSDAGPHRGSRASWQEWRTVVLCSVWSR